MAYNRDQEVELKGTFRNEITDALTDPTEVTLYVRQPDGTVSTYLYSLAQVTRDSLGVFLKNVTLDASGTWYYRFKGTGLVVTSGWEALTVLDDPLD